MTVHEPPSNYRLLKAIKVKSSISALAFSLEGKFLAAASEDNTLRVYDTCANFTTIWKSHWSASFQTIIWNSTGTFITGNYRGQVFKVGSFTKVSTEQFMFG